MIRLSWLQFRAQALTAAAALAAFAILLAATGPHLASRYATSAITGCHGGTCFSAAITFLSQLQATSPYAIVYLLGIAVILVAPAITGIFWGAPLIARELEAGTYQLAWTQSITRTRWLVVKLVLTGLAAVAVTEALSLMYAWWADPIAKAIDLGGSTSLFSGGRFSLATFATHGITPLGYAAFAFTLGTAAGALIRRTVPAMAVTLAIFAAAQVVMPLGVRPHLIPPDHTVATIQSVDLDFGNLTATVVPRQPGAWILSSEAINAAAQTTSQLPAACEAAGSGLKPSSPGPCLESRGFREAITYEPGGRYWPLQWIETGIFLVLALALAGFCFWRVSRRRT
jgi:ABC-type transport system involved in multi-copper enzyme maturation permease subunit